MKRTILIAGDNTDVRHALTDIVESTGYDVVQAESSELAIALAVNQAIDAFILDVDMPKMSGVELCRVLRSLEKYRSTPIFFLTGAGEDIGLSAAFEAGCDDFILKPPNVTVLKARLKSHFNRKDYILHLESARRVLTQYLSKRTLEVVEATSLTGTLPPPEERDLAICFTDIRGFTAFSEEMEPGRLFSLVSSLLAEQVDVIHSHGGYVDKFGGDGVMAIFDGPDMVLQSCLCALRLLDSANVKNSNGGEDICQFGIGLHTGRAVIGHLGSPEHLDYSAIGTSVNLAARLCGQAEATSIVVSKAVRDIVKDDPRLHFHSERRVSIRGMKESVTIFTLSHPV
jgi:adenylate cyclase